MNSVAAPEASLSRQEFARKQIKIARLDAAEQQRWDTFVATCPEATFFHRAGWQEIMRRAFGHRTHFMYAERDGEIEAVLPLVEIKSVVFGHWLASTPFCVYGGVAASNEEARSTLIRAAQNLAGELNVGHIELHSQRVQCPDWHHKDLYYTFRREIAADEEENLLAIPRKQRAMVRKGIKAGLQGTIDNGVDRFFAAYASSVHRLGTPVFSKKYFMLLLEVFGKDAEVLTITQADGALVASVFSFYFRDEVLPYYGGGLPRARDVAGNDFMYWELLCRAAHRGLKKFDFGRSKLGTGAFDFKKNWGFEPAPLPYEYKLVRAEKVPEHNPLNPKYQLMIKTWQRMPLWLANTIGPRVIKYLG